MASCSVTNERRSAKGAMASSESVKINVSDHSDQTATNANGVHSSSQFSCDVKSNS